MKSLLITVGVLMITITGFCQTDSLATDSTQTSQPVPEATPPVQETQVEQSQPAPTQSSNNTDKKKCKFDPKKLTFGGNVGATFGDYAQIYVAPRIGYYLTNTTIFGTQFIYRYTSQKVGFSNERLTSHSYGTGLWARQMFLKRFYLHGEWEAVSSPFYSQKGTEVTEEKEWVNTVMFGGGYYKSLSRKAGVGVSVLYIVNYRDDRTPYPSPWVIRVGAYF